MKSGIEINIKSISNVVKEYKYISGKFGPYTIQLVKPPTAKVDLAAFTTGFDMSKGPSYPIAQVIRTYKGQMDTSGIEQEDVKKAMQDMQHTRLQTPLEMIHFTWLLRGVSRAFTHQIVRYRVGTSFAQESMRFMGTNGLFQVLITHEAMENTKMDGPFGNTNLNDYGNGISFAIQSYMALLDKGVMAEDARGLLPTNILTSIYVDMSFRTLLHIYEQRMCCQAQQGEWQPILLNMKSQVHELDPNLSFMMTSAPERGEVCGFRASFDRPCWWQKKLNAGDDGIDYEDPGAQKNRRIDTFLG